MKKKKFHKELVCERCGNEIPYRRRGTVTCRWCGWKNNMGKEDDRDVEKPNRLVR